MKQMQLDDQDPFAAINRSVGESRRVPLQRKVVLKFHHFGGFFIEYSSNVSMTGMFIKTESPKPAGSVFIFEIWLGDEHRLVHGVGEVVWVRPEEEGADRPAGMGIRYLKIDAESRAVIKRVITEQLEKGGEVFDLDTAAPEQGLVDEVATDRRPELSLVDAGSEPVGRDELLLLDEDLLGFDRPPADEPADSVEPVPLDADMPSAGRGLRAALILIALGIVMGGAAYLFSADLLPFCLHPIQGEQILDGICPRPVAVSQSAAGRVFLALAGRDRVRLPDG